MEARQGPSRSQYTSASAIVREPIRVDPKLPLHASIAPSEALDRSPILDSATQNGMARKASRRRRASGTGPNEKAQLESFPQPPAPEVPRAPPVSYRDPYINGHSSSSRNNNSTSFAARARAIPGDAGFIPTSPPRNHLEPDDPGSADQITRHKRRGSTNSPTGVNLPQGHHPAAKSFEPPLVDPATQQQLPSIATQSQHQSPDQNSPQQAVQRNTSRRYKDATSAPSRSNTRRSSAGLAEPRSEWAADRSPLQKLEVRLNDISKEEKRARVAEAEQQLRESLANGGQRKTSVDVDPTVIRTSSRHVSADAGVRSRREPSGEPRRAQGEPLVQDIAGGSDNFRAEHGHIGGRNGTRTERLPEPLQRDAYQLPGSRHTSPATDQLSPRDRIQQTTGSAADDWGPEQPSGRGVRFEGTRPVEDQNPGLNTQLGSTVQRSYRPDQKGADLQLDRSPGSKGAQQSQQAGYSDGQLKMGNGSSRQVPTAQQELYSQRTRPSQHDDSAAAYGGAPGPVPGHAVRGHNQANDHEIPPQTASGIGAKQKVGFGNTQRGAVETPVHHKHHLSDILHHTQRKAEKQSHDTNAEPRSLDEWRQGGTARLTAADYNTQSSPATPQKAWWEGGKSGGQRSSANASAVQSAKGSYQDDNGTIQFSFSTSCLRSSEPSQNLLQTFGKANVRPYVGNDVLLKDNSKKHSWLQYYNPLLSHHADLNPDLSLSSAYSYSCPHLSEHDIYHKDHICKPYMSKELIKSMRAIRIRAAPKTDSFNPPLYLKCGPLLRYTGLKRDIQQSTGSRGAPSSTEREYWRGSVMIVTLDAESTYKPAPKLRLYPEPMDLLPPPPQRVDGDSGYDLPAEYIDPIAGLPKLSRTGKTIYVKPVEDLDQEVDLSRVEDDTGLYEETRTAAVPTSYGTPDFRPGRGNPQKPVNIDDSPVNARRTMRSQEVRGVRLHAERGCTFWRFNLEIELVAHQARIAYRINNSASVGFWVPAKGQTMNVMFHSCNGFSMSVKYVIVPCAELIANPFVVPLNFPALTLYGVTCSTVTRLDRSMRC